VKVCERKVVVVVVTLLLGVSLMDVAELLDGVANARKFSGGVQCVFTAFCVHSVAMRKRAVAMWLPLTFAL